MDWSSFWPDMLVAGLTTGVIAWLVLTAERRISDRSARRAVHKAQMDAVDGARLLLDRDVVYQSDGLKPETKILRRVRRLVRDVPAGLPIWPVVGYHFVRRSADTAETQEVLIETIDEHISRYEAMLKSKSFVGPAIRKQVSRWASAPRPVHARERFERPPRLWDWTGLELVIPPAVQSQIENDLDLNLSIDNYIHSRHLLSVFREAFAHADVTARSDEWKASIAAAKDAPHNLVKKWWRERQRWKAIQKAWAKASLEADGIVLEFDPYSY